MNDDQKARLRAGTIKGLLASGIMVGIIWSFGYMTGYRMGLPFLPIIAIVFGVVSGAQAYAVDPEKKDDTPDEMLEALRAKEEEQVARARAAKAARRRV